MKSSVNAMISFGLVNIPVGVAGTTTETKNISFKNMHECGSALKVETTGKAGTAGTIKQHLFCEKCGVQVDQVVKGLEYASGQFITFSEGELEAIKPPAGKVITLNKFVPRNDVTTLMVEKSYFLIPNPNVPSGYGLLYQSLAETKMAGVGVQSLWGKEHPCAIYADQSFEGGVMIMQLLRLHEDMVKPDFSAPIPDAKAKTLAKALITANKGVLTDEDLVSSQRIRLNELVAAKLAGVDLPAAAEETEKAVSGDLMEALRQSIAAKPKAPAKAKPKARVKAKV